MTEAIYQINKQEFARLESYNQNQDYLDNLAKKLADEDFEILIYRTHKNGGKYIKLYMLEGFKLRPKTSYELEMDSQIFLQTQFYDSEFRTKNNKLYDFLRQIEEFVLQ